MERSIFEITSKETIVFACQDTDTIISLTTSGLNWWYLVDNGNFVLADKLDAYIDMHRAPISYVRQLAEDWFLHELEEFTGDTSVVKSSSTPMPSATVACKVNDTIPVNVSERNFPLVEPLYLDHDKKDAHTEHCCAKHRCCKFKNSKCTVVSGMKKQTYPCRCL